MSYIKAYTMSNGGRSSAVIEDCYLSGGYVPDSYTMEVPDQQGHAHLAAITSRQTNSFAVFSGSGNCDAARITAQIAAEEMKEEVPRLLILPVENIDALVQRVAGRVREKLAMIAKVDRKMVCSSISLAGIAFRGDHASIHTLGDCRVYGLRAGTVERLGHLEPGNHRYPVNFTGEPAECLTTGAFPLRENDRYLLCSAGLSEILDEMTIRNCLEIEDIQQAARQLLTRAVERGGRRSMTCTIIAWSDHEPERSPATPLAEIDKPKPAKVKIEHQDRLLNRDLKITEELPPQKKQYNDFWEHFPAWVGYAGLAILALMAVLVYLGIKYF